MTNYVGNCGCNSVATNFRQILGGLSRHRGRGVHPPREAAALRAPAVDQAGVPGLLPMGRRFVSLLQVRMASLRKAMREKLGRASNRMQNFSGEKDQVNGPKPFSTFHHEFPQSLSERLRDKVGAVVIALVLQNWAAIAISLSS